ncbi:MAG: DUF1697 domain-containing protein [Gemmatimonadota bacterium]
MSSMKTWIALFRGINVGGNHPLPMKELKLLLEQEGCSDVQTYIQSGNAILRSKVTDTARLAKRITSAVGKSHGFEPHVFVCSIDDFENAVAGNPFPEAIETPKSLHLFFLDDLPKAPNWPAFDALRTMNERFELRDRHFYLYTPEGFGISKLSGRAEKLLGVTATARNWRTITTLLDMAREYP